MPPQHRLSRAEIASLAKGRQTRVHGALFSLAYITTGSSTPAKVACVVSKKIASKAADRNRIRRRSREALRPHMPLLQPGLMLALYAKKDAARASYEEIERDIGRLLART